MKKISRAAVVHLFMCTQTLATVQAEIFQVPQQLFGFFFLQCFFHLGEAKVTCRTAHGPPLHCLLQPTASRSGGKLQVWSSVVGQEHRHTPLSWYPLFLLTPFIFFSALLKKKIILGIQLSLIWTGKLMLVSLTKGCAKQK